MSKGLDPFDMLQINPVTSLTAGCATCLSVEPWAWNGLSDCEVAEGKNGHESREEKAVQLHTFR